MQLIANDLLISPGWSSLPTTVRTKSKRDLNRQLKSVFKRWDSSFEITSTKLYKIGIIQHLA